mmetsp:Transcript_41065/g.113114  ORF Transcript_41065/g.113114 Transcript_41065/m.113114 type:complete len:239 (+) Transcript_41065:34-750(+)
MRQAKEWSPIDRMLSSKRGSKSMSPNTRPQHAQTPDLPPLPSPSPVPPWHPPKPRNLGTATQTASWASLVAEITGTERHRATAFHAELKAIRMQLRDAENAAKESEVEQRAEAATWSETRAALEDELAEARRRIVATEAAYEEERAALLVEADARRRNLEDVDFLRSDLERCREELESVRSERQNLKRSNLALKEEARVLVQERDALLERFEEEQAEMLARVERMERRIPQRTSKLAS